MGQVIKQLQVIDMTVCCVKFKSGRGLGRVGLNSKFPRPSQLNSRVSYPGATLFRESATYNIRYAMLSCIYQNGISHICELSMCSMRI